MKLKIILGAGALAAATALAIPLTAQAPDYKNEITARKAVMQLYVFNLRQLAGMAKGEIVYDGEQARIAANNLAALAMLDQSRMWPAGSDNFSVDDTRALPVLWDNMADAMATQKQLIAATGALAAVAGDGLEAVQANLGPVGQSCAACHKANREPQ